MTPEQLKALALAKARKRRADAEGGDRAVVNNQGLTGFMGGVEQAGAGLNEGIAGYAGAPVDLVTSVLNGLIQRPKFRDISEPSADGSFNPEVVSDGMTPGITDPFGGSGTTTALMDPFISDREPDGAVERYLRRIGQEVGFGVPAALTGASFAKFGEPARAAMTPYMATSMAGDVGAGLAGQTSQEIAPGNATADIIASLVGGGAGALAASRLTPKFAQVPTLDELKAKASAAWDSVKAAPERMTDQATAGLDNAVRRALPDSQLAGEAYPKAYGMADSVAGLRNPTVYDAIEARRIIGDRVAADPSEARVGVAMKREIADYLDNLKPTDLQGGTADDTVDMFRTANRTTHQIKKAEQIINKEMRGESRAATSGTGGNEVNAKRQNIRALYDIERDPTMKARKQGFSPDEMAAMAKIVDGSGGSNFARLVGRMAPTSGALPMMTTGMGGASGLAAVGMGGSPLFAVPAAMAGAGMLGKQAAESMTKGQIAELLMTVLNNGKAPAMSASRAASQRAIVEQLLSSGAQ
jgi:hypothetical protein